MDNDPARASGAQDDYAVTHPLRPVILAGVLSLFLYGFGAGVIYLTLQPTAPAARLQPLAVFNAIFLAVWAALDIAMLLRQPGARERVRLWGPLANLISFVCHFECVWLIWGVLPYVSRDLQFLVVVMLTAYPPTIIICNPQNRLANRVGIVVVVGSTALFLASRDSLAARYLAGYIALFGLTMYLLTDLIRRTVAETVEARLRSDAASRKADRLLAIVAAERDAKTHFISAASHDLGQPLQAIALFFDQILRAPDERTRIRAIDGVRRSLAAAEQLLSHMLNHLRLEADAVEPHLSRVALKALLQKIAAQADPAARAEGMRLKVASGDVFAMLDPVLMERALGNLVNNAILHSRGSKILLAARRAPDGALRIWVVDDGVGVPLADQKYIFDDYYRGAPPGAGQRPGFGLGLASVRRTAKIMGGTADLDTRWSKGAAFYLDFPHALTTVRRASSSIPSIARAA